jgi:hypothetical protein
VGSITGKVSDLSFLTIVQTGSGAQPTPYSVGALSPRLKQPRHEVDLEFLACVVLQKEVTSDQDTQCLLHRDVTNSSAIVCDISAFAVPFVIEYEAPSKAVYFNGRNQRCHI